MVVDVQRGKAADINLILAFPRQRVCELVVEAVDALNHQDVPLPQGEEIPIVLPDALFEIVVGNLHRLAVQQPHHVRVELLHVHGAQALEIVVAVLVPRGPVTVDEVVVRGDGVGPQTAGAELGGQPVGEGRLAGGGGSRDHDKANLLACGNTGGDIADFLLHHGLVGQNEGRRIPLGDNGIQLRHIGDVQFPGAHIGFGQLPEHLHRRKEIP